MEASEESAERRPPPEPSFVLRGHDAVVHCVAFSPPETGLLLAADDLGKVVAWNLDTRREAWSVDASGGAVLAVRTLSEDRFLTQGKDGALKIWSMERPDAGVLAGGPTVCGEVVANLHSFCKSVVMQAAAQPGAAEPVIALPMGMDGAALWDPREPAVGSLILRPRADMDAPNARTTHGQPNPAGQCTSLSALSDTHLLGGFEDGVLRLWDCRAAATPLASLAAHQEPVFGLSATLLDTSGAAPLGKSTVFSGGADHFVAVSHIGGRHSVSSSSEAAAPGEEESLAGDAPSRAEDAGTQEAGFPEEGSPGGCVIGSRARLELKGAGQKGVNYIATRPDQKVFAAGCWDGRVRVFSCKKPRALASLKFHSKGVQCVEFSADSKLMASCSDDTRIALWQIYQ
ncbi:WD40-repeat-containing domain protein [Baffinella frigidus]|nr:WD40-repeat-containing domain protein [Cryptophyta sp. CCMP2293]